MKKLSFYLLPLLALASAGCEKEPEGGSGDSTQFTIVASTDGAILPNWKAQDEIIVVCDDEQENKLRGLSALAASIRHFDIEVIKITVSEELRTQIIAAQTRQKMTNV